MTNIIAPVAVGLALIAILIGMIGVYMPDTPDVSGFVSESQHSEALERIAELENVEHLTTDILDDRYTSTEAVDKLLSLLVKETDLMATFQEEIVKNRDDIRDNHPFNFEPEELPVESEVQIFSSLLEIHIDKGNWLRGETIIFAGNALVNGGQVSALIVEPDGNERYLNAIVHQDGTYNFVFGTNFDSELGEYNISVSQRTRISQTVTFTLGE